MSDLRPRPAYTQAEMEQAARQSQPLNSRGYGYETNWLPTTVDEPGDFRVLTVGTRGMGNHGVDVVVGATNRGRAIVRDGKIAKLISTGITPSVARACACMPRGMEIEVAKLADTIAACMARGLPPRSGGPGRPGIERWLGWYPEGLSCARVESAIHIADRVVAPYPKNP